MRRPPTLLLLFVATVVLVGCGGEDASPTEKACERVVDLAQRTSEQGELSVAEYRAGLSEAWQEAAKEPNSPIAGPLDGSMAIIDRSTSGYLTGMDSQSLMAQFDTIAAACLAELER